MRVTRNFFETTDGHELYYVLYEAEHPKGHIHLVHGMAEHIGRYEEFACFLVANGYSVSGHDQRGHGRTAERNGMRGFFSDEQGFDRVVDDLAEVISTVRHQVGKLPLMVFGHSMGSFVVRRFMQLYSSDLTCVVLSGTGGDPGAAGKMGLFYATAAAKASGKMKVSPILDKLTFGGYNKAFKEEQSPFAWLSSNPEEVAKYENDPMCGFISTNQFFVDLLTGVALVHKPAEVDKIRKELPILLISGAQDPVGGNGKGIFKSAEQYAQAGINEVAVFLAEDARHELLNEQNKYRHYQTILGWLNKYD